MSEDDRPVELPQAPREALADGGFRRLRTRQLGILTHSWSSVLIVSLVTGVSIAAVLVVGWLSPVDQRAGFAAAAAAVATLSVVAWQSAATARAAQAAERGLAATNRALDEAERGRLDQQGPRTWVAIGEPVWPPKQPSTTGGEPQPFKPGWEFALPGSASHLVILQARGSIRNEGDRTVLVSFHGGFRFRKLDLPDGVEWGRREERQRCSIAAGETIEFCVEGELNVQQWTADQPAAIEARISLDDTLDNGVIDTWTVEVGGRPLVLVEGKTNTFAIPKIGLRPGLMTPPIDAQVSPRRRVYWRSKEHRISL